MCLLIFNVRCLYDPEVNAAAEIFVSLILGFMVLRLRHQCKFPNRRTASCFAYRALTNFGGESYDLFILGNGRGGHVRRALPEGSGNEGGRSPNLL